MASAFSLLMTVYAGDQEKHLFEAFRSAVDDQVLRPDHVVLVQDGPVSPELARCLRRLRTESPVDVDLLILERNRGLGPALDAGLSACRHDVVARMDADDVAMPHRFAVQLPMIEKGADLVGAGLLEFGTHIGDIVGRRIPPTGHLDIGRYSRLHDPFNHPTVVYRRSAVMAAGGYGDLPLMEDYWLFVRMIANGARVANTAEPLVYYRVGDGAYERRGGRALLRSELRLQRELRRGDFISRAQYVRNVSVRGGYRLLPTWLRREMYRRIAVPFTARRATPASDAISGFPSIPRQRDPGSAGVDGAGPGAAGKARQDDRRLGTEGRT